MPESRPALSAATARPLALPLSLAGQALSSLAARLAFPYGLPLMLSLAAVLFMEAAARTGLGDVGGFLLSANRPGPTAVIVVFLLLLIGDALFGRLFLSLITVLPPLLLLAFFSGQKRIYLADPLYPADLSFGARQVFELLPAMVEARPLAAVAMALGIVALVGALVFAWLRLRPRMPALAPRARLTRLAIALPLVAGFASIMDYREYSWARDRLGIIPIVWDQAENYRHNGFLLAFSLNLPMMSISSPAGYDAQAIDALPARMPAIAGKRGYKPDIIMVMSESLWDPTRLRDVSMTPDPLEWTRRHASGNVFSPEFGGMTSNVEFEALTGFSNAFLPTGSIPYQQYVRGSTPSLATFFRGEGYTTLALHPFQGWFWNRDAVYNNFGFQAFLSEENLPQFSKRGIFAADADFTDEMMRQADGLDQPFFMFAVTLQGHGPYEPNRYATNTVNVEGPLSAGGHAAVSTYAQGVREADDSLRKLMDWAKRRKRETIVVFFGDHLPPLGSAYMETGTLSGNVPSRNAAPEELQTGRETPLVIWSSRSGVKRAGVVSPSFLPYFVLKMAGFEHPYYTGVLGNLHEKYAVIDRHMLLKRDGTPIVDWSRDTKEDPAIREMRLLQYDIMFGKGYGIERFFPSHVRLGAEASS